MKILLSSVACSPFGGSEGIYGWRACRAIADLHEVWVLTDAGNRDQIEQAKQQGLVPKSMHFEYLGSPRNCHSNRLIARLQSWRRYQEFQKASLAIAMQLHSKIGFDLAQLITFTTWRVGCPLWKMKIPFIWGPISGTEMFPWRFLKMLSPISQIFELFRAFSTWRSRRNQDVRDCAVYSSKIIAIHEQSRSFLADLRRSSNEITVYSSWFFEDEHIATLTQPRDFNSGSAPLRMVAGGNLEGRKGIAVALHALRKVADAGIPFHYRVTSRGPELPFLLRLVKKLALEDSVHLGEPFPAGKYVDRLREFDICLLPSLREGGGLTLMESMLAGCVPIVAACGGPGDTVTIDCGFPIPVTTPEKMIDEIANAVIQLHRNREALQTLGTAARTRLQSRATEKGFRDFMERVYAALTLEKTIPSLEP